MSERQRVLAAIGANPPSGWRALFGPIPTEGRWPSSKVRCLLCGARGYSGMLYPLPWQVPHIAGHPERCATCRRPFINGQAIAGHQRCKLHHDCCLDHTSVPEWANPFAMGGAA